MNAMVLEKQGPVESGPLRWTKVEAPQPAENEVLVWVACCAVCRTDLHIVEGDLPPAKLPVVPGHQIVGRVERTGKECTRFKPGDRVGVAWLRHTCGACDLCLRGRENLCEASRYTGYHADGGYAEWVVAPEDYVYALPEGYSDIEAAPLLCSGIIGYRALKRAQPPDGGTLALYGFGASAHVVLPIAKARGLRVLVVSRGEEHLRLARELGADWAGVDPASMPTRPDSAILFAPVGTLVPVALEHLRRGGTLSLAGIHLSDVPPLNYEKHLFYERDVHPVTANTREDARELLAEAAKTQFRPKATVYPLAEANRALVDLKGGRISGSGVLVN
ncbi:MAG: zinc-dependent alcohol dehydrogenase family protein [Candidatus Hydrogenedentes bacterium]|nr:zinc-dependent alcohol dehydrogenase family protein [Candidatus Hydrogenedentota bacterium]